MGFIEDLFNTNKVRYTVLEEMTADILKIAKDRAAQISSILGIKNHKQRYDLIVLLTQLYLFICLLLSPHARVVVWLENYLPSIKERF